jgi:hypothetical protein
VPAIVRGVVAWIIGAAVAIEVGMLALSRIGFGLPVDAVQPMIPDAATGPSASPVPVRTEPSPSAVTHRPAPSRSASPQATPHGQVFSSAGGTAIVRCTGVVAYLISWSPGQGYQLGDVRRGPAAAVYATFQGRQKWVLLSSECVGGVPQARISSGNRRHDE